MSISDSYHLLVESIALSCVLILTLTPKYVRSVAICSSLTFGLRVKVTQMVDFEFFEFLKFRFSSSIQSIDPSWSVPPHQNPHSALTTMQILTPILTKNLSEFLQQKHNWNINHTLFQPTQQIYYSFSLLYGGTLAFFVCIVLIFDKFKIKILVLESRQGFFVISWVRKCVWASRYEFF